MTRFLLLLFILLQWPAVAEDPAAERIRRFNDCKFGMFIHWGPYSLASVEASWPLMRPEAGTLSEADYRSLPARFNPVRFDPKAWVKLAKAAGQRYMVFTSKHHDGFAMFDSAFTEYKITRTPYGKDIAAMLAKAAHDEVLPFGFYYSPPDMHHAAYRDTAKPSRENWKGEAFRPEWPLYLSYMELQLRELLTRYGDLFVIWFDGLGLHEKWDGVRFHKMIRELQPRCLINNRIGPMGDYATPEQRLPKGIPTRHSKVANFSPRDEALAAEPPKPEDFQPWETCMTINGTWAYNRNDLRYKSTTELIRTLIDAASKGGNFLLNVGPTPEGAIQPEFEERLLAMGEWLKANGESIYGTTYGPLQSLPFGRTTAKGRTVYAHVFDWPSASLEIAGLKHRVRQVSLLASKKPLKFTQEGDRLRIDTTSVTPNLHATVLALEAR